MSDISEIVLEAERFVKEREKGKRLNGKDEWTHPFAVRDILVKFGYDSKKYQLTALLHDVVENKKATYEEIKTRFGNIAKNLYILDRNTVLESPKTVVKERQDFVNHDEFYILRMDYDYLISEDPINVIVKIGDLINNMEDPENLGKYNRKIGEVISFYLPIALTLNQKLGLELANSAKRVIEYAKKEGHILDYTIDDLNQKIKNYTTNQRN